MTLRFRVACCPHRGPHERQAGPEAERMWGDKSGSGGKRRWPWPGCEVDRGPRAGEPPDPTGTSAPGPGLGLSGGPPAHLAPPGCGLTLWHLASGGRPMSPAPRGGRVAQRAGTRAAIAWLRRKLAGLRVCSTGRAGGSTPSLSTQQRLLLLEPRHWDPAGRGTRASVHGGPPLPQREGTFPASRHPEATVGFAGQADKSRWQLVAHGQPSSPLGAPHSGESERGQGPCRCAL